MRKTIEVYNQDANLFVTPDGELLGELQWVTQCYEEERTLHTAVHCEEDLLESLLIQLPYDPEYPASDIYYYHSDHLGSASWITNSSGDPVQYIHYMPYGELWKNQQRKPYNERFKFTGKERDEETGYDFFGARNYTSAASIWLSVDPLVDKYPYISPYAYCHWNPIKYVDPDGRDDFEVNWNSETREVTINQIENKNFDQFHIIDTDGNRIASSKRYDYRTITKLRNGTWGKSNLSLFDVNGDDNAEDIFKFLSSNFTSPIEWSRVMVGTSKSGRNIIGTSMKENATGIGHYIMHNGYTIRGVDHNHPHGTGPSTQDINNASSYHLNFPEAILRVFVNGIYIPYDKNSIMPSANGGELKEIEIIGMKK